MADVAALKAEVAASSATLVQVMSMDEAALSAALEAAGLQSTGSKAELKLRLRNHVLERMELAHSQLPEESFESTVLEDTSAPGPATRGKRQR